MNLIDDQTFVNNYLQSDRYNKIIVVSLWNDNISTVLYYRDFFFFIDTASIVKYAKNVIWNE